jgi:NADH-quinone oxidoreductase subunit M
MGFVTLGIFTLNQTGLEGGILQMINHGVVTGALFLCVGIIYERTHTRMIEDYGGLSKSVPVYATFFALFSLAAIGFPGMNAFIGEFLIISGAFKTKTVLGVLSVWGIILGVTYMAWLYYRVVLNETNPKIKPHLYDMDFREIATLLPLVFLVFLIGVQPEILLSYMHISVEHLIKQLNAGTGGEIFNVSDSAHLIAHYIKDIF